MKLTKTRLRQIIREELNEEFRVPYMGRHRKSQIGGENIRKWTKKGYDFDSTEQGLLTVAIVKEPSGEILRIFHDVPTAIFLRRDDNPDVKKAMGLKRGMRAYAVKDVSMWPPTDDPKEIEKKAEELFAKVHGFGRKHRIPTHEYIEKHYPDMPQFDFNDFMTPQGPRGGGRGRKSVIGDLEDGE